MQKRPRSLQTYAIIGRDILNHMLLLYRGRANRNALPNAKIHGRLYYGVERWRTGARGRAESRGVVVPL